MLSSENKENNERMSWKDCCEEKAKLDAEIAKQKAAEEHSRLARRRSPNANKAGETKRKLWMSWRAMGALKDFGKGKEGSFR